MSAADRLDAIEARARGNWPTSEDVAILAAALRAALDLVDERDEETAEVYGDSEVAASSLVTTHEVRDAITAALDAS